MQLTTEQWPKDVIPRITDRAYKDMRRLMCRFSSSAKIINLLQHSRVGIGKFEDKVRKRAERRRCPLAKRYCHIQTGLVFQVIGKTIVAVYSRDYKKHKPPRRKRQ